MSSYWHSTRIPHTYHPIGRSEGRREGRREGERDGGSGREGERDSREGGRERDCTEREKERERERESFTWVKMRLLVSFARLEAAERKEVLAA